MTYKAQLIFPHVPEHDEDHQSAAEIAKKIPELSAQQVAAELSWNMDHKYVEHIKQTKWHRIAKIWRKKAMIPTIREEALER